MIEIVPYSPSDHTAEILRVSMAAWSPVFEQLEAAVPAYVYEAFYPKGWRARQTADIEGFLAAEGDRVWVALSGAELAGWVGIRLHPKDRMGEIYILAVDPKHQRKGVATLLVDHGLAKMREHGMAIAMVETGDDPGHGPSRATYERSGFECWPVARYFRQL